MNRFKSPNQPKSRAGTVYVAVLGVSLIVAVMAAGAIAVQRTQRHIATREADIEQARLNALTGIEMGRLHVKQNSAWRTTYPNGVWQQDVALAVGSYTLSGVDPADGDLTNDELQSVALTATGTSGTAVQSIAATFLPEIVPLDCLDAAAVGVGVSFNNATVNADAVIVSNASMAATNADVYSDVAYHWSRLGSVYHGAVSGDVPTRDMPDSNTVFDYYIAHGTPITLTELVEYSEGPNITGVVLSPNANPYGTGQTNSQGIYVLDCQGQAIHVRDSRIVGTLVLLDPAASSDVQKRVNWSPAVSNLPALLVRGDIDIDIDDAKSVNESQLDVNFNPIGTPYNGAEDTDQSDIYPTAINGLVYVSGNCSVTEALDLTGVLLVGGELTFSKDATLTYDATYTGNPPPGFRALPLKPVAGSWHRVVN